jgi:hypothetical protein
MAACTSTAYAEPGTTWSGLIVKWFIKCLSPLAAFRRRSLAFGLAIVSSSFGCAARWPSGRLLLSQIRFQFPHHLHRMRLHSRRLALILPVLIRLAYRAVPSQVSESSLFYFAVHAFGTDQVTVPIAVDLLASYEWHDADYRSCSD